MLALIAFLGFQATAPTLDGTISPGEYAGGSVLSGTAGLVVHVRPDDDAIYIAAQGAAGGFPHLVVSRGDTVLLLHASAALGTARFAGAAATKAQVQAFTWDVRNAGATAAGDAAREQHYSREGWTATTVEMGVRGVTEFKVSRALLPAGTRFVVAFWADGGQVQHWPSAVSDDAVAVRMIQGFLPTTATFTVSAWGRAP